MKSKSVLVTTPKYPSSPIMFNLFSIDIHPGTPIISPFYPIISLSIRINIYIHFLVADKIICKIYGKDCCERQNPQVLGKNGFIRIVSYHLPSQESFLTHVMAPRNYTTVICLNLPYVLFFFCVFVYCFCFYVFSNGYCNPHLYQIDQACSQRYQCIFIHLCSQLSTCSERVHA